MDIFRKERYMDFKIGGFYETKDKDWFFINEMKGNDISGRFIYIDDEFYDEDIVDITKQELAEKLLDGKCWVGRYDKDKGLYAVWDGANKSTLRKLR